MDVSLYIERKEKGRKWVTDIRKKYDAALKAKIALEAVKGDKTIREISSAYGVHSNQIMTWKQQLLEELPSIFSDKKVKAEKERKKSKKQSYTDR